MNKTLSLVMITSLIAGNTYAAQNTVSAPTVANAAIGQALSGHLSQRDLEALQTAVDQFNVFRALRLSHSAILSDVRACRELEGHLRRSIFSAENALREAQELLKYSALANDVKADLQNNIEVISRDVNLAYEYLDGTKAINQPAEVNVAPAQDDNQENEQEQEAEVEVAQPAVEPAPAA